MIDIADLKPAMEKKKKKKKKKFKIIYLDDKMLLVL